MRGPLTLIAFLSISFCFGQDLLIKQTFHNYEVVEINVEDVMNLISKTKSPLKEIRLGRWDLSLSHSRLLSSRYKIFDQDGNIYSEKRTTPLTLSGTSKTGGKASITISKNFVMGFIQEGKETYYIEPISHFVKNASPSSFILYKAQDIKKGAPIKCALQSVQEEYTRGKDVSDSNRNSSDLCYEIEYFVANDFSMLDKYGAVGLEARNIAILNDVNTNFDNEFDNEIRLILTGQYLSTCAACNPWSSSLDFTAVLNSFRDWGNVTIGNPNSSSFTSYDIASLWSDRWSASLIVGQAFLNGVCTTDRYNLLSDFSASSSALRVLVSHEIGHNLNAFHDADGSGTIMSPSINVTNTWSSSSINAINNTISSSSCLSFCSDLPVTVFWDSPILNINESASLLDEEGCNSHFTEYAIPVRISKPPSSDVQVLISTQLGTASEGIDFEVLTNSILFTTEGSTSQEVTIRIYDDAIIETEENFGLQFLVFSGPAIASNNNTFNINIRSEDESITSAVSPGDTFYYGQAGQLASSNGFFEGSRTDVKTRFLIRADRLISMGLQEGSIDMLSLFVIEKNSSGSFENFRIGLTETESDNLSSLPWLATSTVFMDDISTVNDWNNFDFSMPYFWNGSSNIYVELCFDNSSSIGGDKIVLFKTEGNLGQLYSYSSNELDQCGGVTSTGWTNNRSPVLLLRQKLLTLVEDFAINSGQSYLQVGEKAVFYSDRNRLIASLENIGPTDLECVQVSIRSEGSGRTSLDIANGRSSDKSYRVKMDNNASYRLTMYYNEAETSIWSGGVSNLKSIVSETPITDLRPEQSEVISVSSYERIPDVENSHAFTVESSGTKYFALSDWEAPSTASADVSSFLYDGGLSFEAIGGGIILTSFNNEEYILRLNSLGSLLFFKNSSLTSSSVLESGDLFIASSSKALSIAATENTAVSISIDALGNLARTDTLPPPIQNIKVDSGFLKLSEAGAGIVFKNLDNECYKLYVNGEGVLTTGLVDCP